MATTTSSSLLAAPRFSTQIAGSPATDALRSRSAPVLRIRSSKRFAASRCDVSLFLPRFPRPPPRRRNALRDKASSLWPPLIVQRQARRPRPYDEPTEFGPPHSQELKSGSLDIEASSGPEEELEISGALGASRRVASQSKLNGEKGMTGVAEGITFSGTRADPLFSFCGEPEGNVTSVEVNEDGIINMSEALEGVRSVDPGLMFSRARVMAMELKSGKGVGARVMAMELKSGKGVDPKNSSLFQIATADSMNSVVLNEEVSAARGNVTSFGWLAGSCFVALCGVCLAFAMSKFRQTARLTC